MKKKKLQGEQSSKRKKREGELTKKKKPSRIMYVDEDVDESEQAGQYEQEESEYTVFHLGSQLKEVVTEALEKHKYDIEQTVIALTGTINYVIQTYEDE